MGRENLEFYYSAIKTDNTASMSDHYHPFHEIYYLKEGKCKYFISNKTYDIEPDTLVFVRRETIHKTTYNAGHSRILLQYSEEFLSDIEFPDFYVYRNDETNKSVLFLLSKIEEEYVNADDFSKGMIAAYLRELLVLIYRSENEYKNSIVQNKYIEEVLKYLRENYSSEITLYDAAKKISLSQEYLSRLFKKETGIGFNEYLSTLRLKKAEQILRQGGIETVTEIAYECGFNDSNYFCEKFKKAHGISPIKYRSNFQIEGEKKGKYYAIKCKNNAGK